MKNGGKGNLFFTYMYSDSCLVELIIMNNIKPRKVF